MNESAPQSKSGAEIVQEKVESTLKEAGLEKTIQIVARLEEEVKIMVMPERFSSTNVVTDRPYSVSGEAMTQPGLTDAEAKRAELLLDLKALREKVEDVKQSLVNTTIDIAATGLPGGWLS